MKKRAASRSGSKSLSNKKKPISAQRDLRMPKSFQPNPD